LFPDHAVEEKVHSLLDVLKLVFIRYCDVFAVWNQVDLLLFAEELTINCEYQACVFDVFIDHPLKTLVKFVIKVFKVTKGNVFPEDHLVEWLREVAIHMVAIEKCFTDHAACEFEVLQVV
jgi:hypothetical protein